MSTSRSARSHIEMPCWAIRSAGLLVHEGAAAGRQDHRSFLEKARDDAAFAVAKMGLAVDGENVGDRHAGGGLDLVIGIAERQAELLREPAADGTLSRAHEADEHKGSGAEAVPDRFAARLSLSCSPASSSGLKRLISFMRSSPNMGARVCHRRVGPQAGVPENSRRGLALAAHAWL